MINPACLEPVGALALSLAFAFALAGASACSDDRSSPPSPPPSGSGSGASEQSFAEAVRIMCDTPREAEMPPEAAGPANAALVIGNHLDARIANPEARRLLAAEAARAKIGALEAAAARAGISDCALVDTWTELSR